MLIKLATNVSSWTGKYLYSDNAPDAPGDFTTTLLDKVAYIPFIGTIAGVGRIALGIIHSLGHLGAALLTGKKGHLFHALKGVAEISRGVIELIPIVSQCFFYGWYYPNYSKGQNGPVSLAKPWLVDVRTFDTCFERDEGWPLWEWLSPNQTGDDDRLGGGNF